MNSIRESVSKQPQSFEAELAILIRSLSVAKKLLIVTEGKSDVCVFERFYCADKYKVWSSEQYSGCNKLESAAIDLNRKYSDRFIMIKDADFDHLNCKTYDSLPNFFLTDTHDIETMMLSDSFYAKIKETWAIDDAASFCAQALNEILCFSYVKWMNDKNGLQLQFCKIGSFYDGTQKISARRCLTALSAKNQGKVLPSVNDMEAFMLSNPVGKEILQITNGHDMIGAFAVKLRRQVRGNVSRSDIENWLSESYTFVEYQKTALCNAVSNWVKTKSKWGA